MFAVILGAMNEPPFSSLHPVELKEKLDRGEKLRLIDVRELREWNHCRIEGAELLPLSEIESWMDQLDSQGGPYVIYCHHGVRSANVCYFLSERGVKNCINLSGGIDLWSKTVDPAVPLY